MNIPETLRGKEAEGLGILILSVIENYMVTEATKLLLILEYIKFYLQPFTPSPIEELFEVLKIWGGNGKNIVTISPHNITLTKNNECWEIAVGVSHYSKIFTLSDFISACNKCGIELKWKEQK